MVDHLFEGGQILSQLECSGNVPFIQKVNENRPSYILFRKHIKLNVAFVVLMNNVSVSQQQRGLEKLQMIFKIIIF